MKLSKYCNISKKERKIGVLGNFFKTSDQPDSGLWNDIW